MATSAYSAGVIARGVLKGVTTKNLTTTRSERMLGLLMSVHIKIIEAKDAAAANKTMQTFVGILKEDAAYKKFAKSLGKAASKQKN